MREDEDDCACEFDYDEGDGEETWHFTRTCRACGFVWGALHCPHDGVQNPCPDCGWRDPGTQTPFEFLGFTSPPRPEHE